MKYHNFTVAEFCWRSGMSRETIYAWKRRLREAPLACLFNAARP
jgi:hypothetical protein